MISTAVSAPGKLLLFGEHAVVYGYPCIVTAVDTRLVMTAQLLNEPIIRIELPDVEVKAYDKPIMLIGKGDVPKGARFIEAAISNLYKKKIPQHGVSIKTQAQFSSQYGLGSSSAAAVCTLKAVSDIYGSKLGNRQIFDLGYQTVLDVQGVGSGFDVAAAVYGKTLYFTSGGSTITPLVAHDLPLVIGFSGEKADTASLVRGVAQKRSKYPEKVERIFQAISRIVEEAKIRMGESDWTRVGKLFDFNHEYLRNLGVSTGKLETLISAAKSAGALGAKLSGAGGGDCMIALHPPGAKAKRKIEQAIEGAGGTIITAMPNAAGVRIETTDNQKEEFIVVDINDNVLGYRSRYDCHHDRTLIHRTVGVIIFDSKGRILLQKRSSTKDTDPGKWGISCAGHVTRGQTNDDAIARELSEELGIVIPLAFVKKFITREPLETEMAALYKGKYDGPFHVNDEEVDRVEFFDIPSLKEKVRKGEILLSGGTPQTLREAGIL